MAVRYCFITLLFFMNSISWALVLNSPYLASESKEKIYYSSFSEQPKTLDPAKSYASNEYVFVAQIYEPPLQYDYHKRPYQLIPLMAKAMPSVRFYNANHQEIKTKSTQPVAFSVYHIELKPGIVYQKHPAFSKDNKAQYRYLSLPSGYLEEQGINTLADFPYQGTRLVNAQDYIYQIKRLANPAVGSPIYGLMSEYIVGFSEFAKVLPVQQDGWVDLRQYPLSGVKKIDDLTFEITLKGEYPQFVYWLSMPFFVPIPWEADKFYAQSGMSDNNIGFGWFPVGTGPFVLSENNPNKRMVLTKNPNFRPEQFKRYPDSQSSPYQTLPLIDKAIYILEKEAIPRWCKFIQGYYDLSGISADKFDEAISVNAAGKEGLTKALEKKHISLLQSNDAAIYYIGFNMLDPIVGGKSERARLLRQAIAIAINQEEYVSIFYNGRGVVAQGPIPPGIFGFKDNPAGLNPYVYHWQDGLLKRQSIRIAKALLRKAGYPDGINPKTHKPLILHYDVAVKGGPDDKSLLDWMSKQFLRIGISLNIRATLYNRFQEKLRLGNAQIFSWGWLADYPDPENFLFALYSGNGMVKYGGENASNYSNPEYDRLFLQMKYEPNGERRQAIIDRMVEIVRFESPWIFSVNPKLYTLVQSWLAPMKPATVIQNGLKYIEVNVALRNQQRLLWNRPSFWPIVVILLLLALFLLPGLIAYRRSERASAMRLR